MRPREIALYLQVTPRQNYGRDNDLRLVSATTNPPESRVESSAVVKVRLRIPREAFEPAQDPVAVVDVPLDLVQPSLEDLKVEAVAP